ncbi:MAG: hypothetical protein AB8B88_03290 [Devosiaceae bacterium]
MQRLAMDEGDPIFMRIFKEEAELEVWKRGPQGRYLLLESYEICTWSGELGPKFQEGDRQAPEGFYTITPAQMNPNSSFYLSFNLGFPNSFDRSHGRTGSHLMVHGACSSAGCYAMTDDQIGEIYSLGREAFEGGQRAFQVHAFPFRMTPENMARFAGHRHFPFWQMLQEGYQHFELTKTPPQVDVCDRRYIFNAVTADQFSAAQQCPSYQLPPDLERAFSAAQAEHQAAFEVALADMYPDGIPAELANQRVMFAGAQPTTPAPVANAAAPTPPVSVPAPVVASAPPLAPVAPAAPAPPPLVPVAEPVTAAVPASVPVAPPLEPVASTVVEPVVETAATPAAENSSFAARAGGLFDSMFSGN